MGKNVRKIAEGIGKCGNEAKNYAVCITKNMDDMHRNACQAEFLQFKKCVTKVIQRKW